MMEEVASPTRQKFQMVEEKLGQLTQSQLQNLSDSSLKQLQERLNAIEKKLADEIASN
jgi:hypothetical protein